MSSSNIHDLLDGKHETMKICFLKNNQLSQKSSVKWSDMGQNCSK